MADWLIALRKENAAGRPQAWDRLEFGGIADDDEAMGPLLEQLARSAAPSSIGARRKYCWRVELPNSWEEYLAGLSKSHRKQLRRFQRRLFASGRAVLRTVATEQEFRQAFEILIDLHRRRRESLGDRGCFHSGRFTEFHREIAWRFFERGLLRLSWLELDSRPVACEYQLLGGETVYAYQSGIDPAALEEEPGRLATMATLRAAIESGYRVYDLLRGDEAYKAHWRTALPVFRYPGLARPGRRLAAARRVGGARESPLVGQGAVALDVCSWFGRPDRSRRCDERGWIIQFSSGLIGRLSSRHFSGTVLFRCSPPNRHNSI